MDGSLATTPCSTVYLWRLDDALKDSLFESRLRSWLNWAPLRLISTVPMRLEISPRLTIVAHRVYAHSFCPRLACQPKWPSQSGPAKMFAGYAEKGAQHKHASSYQIPPLIKREGIPPTFVSCLDLPRSLHITLSIPQACHCGVR